MTELQRSLLRIVSVGSVDDGKSTLIGRILKDCRALYSDQLAKIKSNEDLAMITDGLKSEIEQKITIDVAYRYFSTPRRHFILADTPGHEQYTRNMVTGASTADLAILLIDARKGMTRQTRRHALICSLLGIPRIIVAINKMDAVDWDKSVYEKAQEDFAEYSRRLSFVDVRFVPVSALQGENFVETSSHMPWYSGEPLIPILESIHIESDRNLIDFRFPVQWVIRPDQDKRYYAGQIASGVVRCGDRVAALGSQQVTQIRSIYKGHQELEEAFAPMSVVLELEDQIDLGRGDMLVRENNQPKVESELEAMIVWVNENPFDWNGQYQIRHTTRTVGCRISKIHSELEVETLGKQESSVLSLNQIARVSLSTHQPLFYDVYSKNKATGSFILVDALNNHTVAAGTFLERKSASIRKQEGVNKKNLSFEKGFIEKEQRAHRFQHRGLTVWFTGLSGAGKSTLASRLELALFEQGKNVFRLDGDNLRKGLCEDLGFTDADRSENIRRVAETAKLFNLSGQIVICSFISPFERDRELAKKIVGEDEFLEIFIDCPLPVCEERDPKGLYKKARGGEIPSFTGIDSPYEEPQNPDLRVDTSQQTIDQCLALLVEMIDKKSRLD